jgi:hypothetical protein
MQVLLYPFIAQLNEGCASKVVDMDGVMLRIGWACNCLLAVALSAKMLHRVAANGDCNVVRGNVCWQNALFLLAELVQATSSNRMQLCLEAWLNSINLLTKTRQVSVLVFVHFHGLQSRILMGLIDYFRFHAMRRSILMGYA